MEKGRGIDGGKEWKEREGNKRTLLGTIKWGAIKGEILQFCRKLKFR